MMSMERNTRTTEILINTDEKNHSKMQLSGIKLQMGIKSGNEKWIDMREKNRHPPG